MVEQVLENKLYNIRPGDTLLAIAAVAKVPYEDILKLNPQISNPNLIRAGDTLILPASISRQKLLVDTALSVYPGDAPLWFKIAHREIGVSEKPGSNPRILEYLATTTLPEHLKSTDATAWCSAFANWSLKTAGIKGTNSAWALNWKDWGKNLQVPQLGAITVLTRKSDTTNGGHVGFLVEETATAVTLLGGNQGNAVSIASFPKNGKKGSYHYKLVGMRWPA